jgi:hypothetical protein
MKKPKLTPPDGLAEAGARLWRSVVAEHEIKDVASRETLYQICVAADRAVECKAQIDREGPSVKTNSGLFKEHPLLKMELAQRSFVVKGLHRLGIMGKNPVGRPATGNACGITYEQLDDRDPRSDLLYKERSNGARRAP